MYIKKICKIAIISIFLASTIVHANNIDEEQIDFNQIKEEIAETSSNIETVPSINSKSAIVLERATRDHSVWKR